jgi:hypothetical protein
MLFLGRRDTFIFKNQQDVHKLPAHVSAFTAGRAQGSNQRLIAPAIFQRKRRAAKPEEARGNAE